MPPQSGEVDRFSVRSPGGPSQANQMFTAEVAPDPRIRKRGARPSQRWWMSNLAGIRRSGATERQMAFGASWNVRSVRRKLRSVASKESSMSKRACSCLPEGTPPTSMSGRAVS